MQLIAASVNVLLAAAKHSTLKKSQSFFLDKVATMNGGGGVTRKLSHTTVTTFKTVIKVKLRLKMLEVMRMVVKHWPVRNWEGGRCGSLGSSSCGGGSSLVMMKTWKNIYLQPLWQNLPFWQKFKSLCGIIERSFRSCHHSWTYFVKLL